MHIEDLDDTETSGRGFSANQLKHFTVSSLEKRLDIYDKFLEKVREELVRLEDCLKKRVAERDLIYAQLHYTKEEEQQLIISEANI